MITVVFKVIGFELKTPDGSLLEGVTVWVYAETADEAIAKAKAKGVEKTHWQVLEIIEKYTDDCA